MNPLNKSPDSMNKNKPNILYNNRLTSIDMLRGIALLLMALDHTRDFFGYIPFSATDLTQTNIILFFTRWITHFCAPTFILLSGISAYLFGLRHSQKKASQFLLTRGLWLIFLELTVVTFAWKFAWTPVLLTQVIFVLGASMIILSGLVWLPRKLIFIISITTILGSSLLNNWTFHSPFLTHWQHFIYGGYDYFKIGSFGIETYYSIIPWFAVMSLGYTLGPWFSQPVSKRIQYFLWAGIFCFSLFFILRYLNYGDIAPWTVQGRGKIYTMLSFLNATKYPASLDFLLITLTGIFGLLVLLEKWDCKNQLILTFGKVSLFFYIIHLYLIHITALFYARFILQANPEWWWQGVPWVVPANIPLPSTYEYSLLRVYIVWAIIVLISYPLCLAFSRFKSTHQYYWLSYL